MRLVAWLWCFHTVESLLPSSVHPSYAATNGKNSIPLLAMPDGTKKKSALYPFHEARKIARGHGFESKEEFMEYACPGAYQLPKNPQEVWSESWKGWEDFLGVCHEFEPGRELARGLNLRSEEEYLRLFKEKKIDDDDPASRLPYRPDLKYKEEWKGWDDWLVKP